MDGEDGKREGMARAWHGADPHWRQCMLESLKEVALRKPVFNTDDVVGWCRTHHPNATTREKRAIGPLMRYAAKLGYCEPIEGWTKSIQAQCHSRPIRTWFSLAYRGPVIPKPRRRAPIYDPRKHTLGA
jgi:hypothetical protein